MSRILEVCVDSIESGVRAAVGGALRIELCAALSEGGLTPNLGTFVQLKKRIAETSTKIFVMLRPRRGTDFHYSEDEMLSILLDVEEFKTRGADGFVFGALCTTEEIDIPNCRRVIAAADPLPVTFHRAFDCLQGDAAGQLNTLIDLGFKRLLTSGREPSAELGIAKISSWSKEFGQRIIIMPGAGINQGNLSQIIDQSGCREFHSSCKEKTAIPLDPIIGDLDTAPKTDQQVVEALCRILHK